MNILSAALSTLSVSPTAGLLLAGELAAAAWMVERFARQTIKIRKQDQALAYERTFSRSLSLLDHEVYLLLRRSDTFPLYVAGDLPGLTGLTLEDMQRDIACFFQLMSAADAKTLRRMLEEWDRSAPLRLTFYSKWEGRWLELCALPAENSHYTMLNLRDVSTLRQRQEEMARQLEEAQAASRSKTEFLSRMSHEIRTPINGINGLMALTRTRLGGSNPAAEEYLTRAEDLSQHLLSVINDILDLSRIETGKTELEQKSFDLYALGDHLRSMFQKTVPLGKNSGTGGGSVPSAPGDPGSVTPGGGGGSDGGGGWVPVDVTPGFYLDAYILRQLAEHPQQVQRTVSLSEDDARIRLTALTLLPGKA